jgi:hypothetical protein
MGLPDVRVPIGADNDIGANGRSLMEHRQEADILATSRPAGPLAHVLFAYFFADAISAAIIHGRADNDLAGVFVFAIFASQALLLVMWVGLGNVAIWIRLLCAVAWCLWITLLGTTEPLRWNVEFLGAAGLMLLSAAAPFGVLKTLGFRIVWRRKRVDVRWRRDVLQQDAIAESIGTWTKVEAVPELLPDAHHLQPAGVQFSILQIFGWTALAGVMAVLARIAGLRIGDAIPMSILVIVASAVGFATLWAVLGGQRVGARLLAPFGAVVLVTLVGMTFAGLAPGGFIVDVFASLILATAAVAGVLGLFRSAGYRVRRGTRSIVRPVGHVATGAQPGASNPWDSERL